MPVTLQAETRTNGQTARAIIEQDVDGDGVAEHVETVDLKDGSKTYDLSTFAETDSADYNVYLDLESSDPTTSPEVLSPLTIGTGVVAASGVGVTEASDGSVDIDWSRQDSLDTGGWRIFRSRDGSLGTEIADITDPLTTSYNDATVLQGTEYFYTVRRYDGTVTKDSQQKSLITDIPAPTTVEFNETESGQYQFTWTDEAQDELGYVLIASINGGDTWTEESSVTDKNTESLTSSGVGTTADYKIRTVGNDTTADSPSSVSITPEGYYSNGLLDQWTILDPTETPLSAEEGEGAGTYETLPGHLFNENWGKHSEDKNTIYALDQNGNEVQGIPLKGQESGFLRIDQTIEIPADAEYEWPIRVDTQVRIKLDDLSKLQGFDASMYSECSSNLSIENIEEITGTNEVIVDLTALFNCPEEKEPGDTIDGVIDIQPDGDGDQPVFEGGGGVNYDGSPNNGNIGHRGDGAEWESPRFNFDPTPPPIVSCGGTCIPKEHVAKIPLKMYYYGDDADPIYGYRFGLDYDEDILSFSHFENPSADTDKLVFDQPTLDENYNGYIDFHATSATGDDAWANNNGFEIWRRDHSNTLTYMVFDIVGDNGDRSYINFVDLYRKDDPETEYEDESFFPNSEFVGYEPAHIYTKYGQTVSYTYENYEQEVNSREDWVPFQLHNGSVGVGNGLNISGDDTSVGAETKVTVTMDATSHISGFNIDILYPDEDSTTPFEYVRCEEGDINIRNINAEDDRGIVSITGDEEALDNDYEDPTLFHVYFKPVSIYDRDASANIEYLDGEIWDVNRQKVPVDCSGSANLKVDSSAGARPATEADRPSGSSDWSPRNSYVIDTEEGEIDWPLIVNQTFTINGLVTNNLEYIEGEIRSTTNPNITYTQNDWWVIDEDSAAVNLTFTLPKADPQQYPPTFHPVFSFEWGNGHAPMMNNGYINQSNNATMGTSTSNSGIGISLGPMSRIWNQRSGRSAERNNRN